MNKKNTKSSLLRFLPLAVLLAGAVVFFAFDGVSYVNLDTLKQYRHELIAQIERLGFAAPFIYALLYALTTAFALPLGLVMTLVAGFLFGFITGLLTVVIGATLGATACFLAVRMGFGPAADKFNAPWFEKMRQGFNENAFNYMLVIRLVPIFPFFIANVAPAFLNVSLPVYFFGTLLGIIPASAVYILLGSGLSATFDAGGTPNLGIILEPHLLAPIIGLAVLALIPVLYRRITRKKEKTSHNIKK